MPDPFRSRANQPYARTEPDLIAAGEVRTPLDDFLTRLQQLGASPDQVQSVADTWDQFDTDDGEDSWTPERRAMLMALGDTELGQLIDASRDEYNYATTSEEDAAAADHTRHLEAAIAEAQGRIGANVQSVAAWVGDDPVRAEAVLRLELAPEGANRTTLISQVAPVARFGTDELDALRASYQGG